MSTEGMRILTKEDVNACVDLFYLWCIGVHQGQVEETRFPIAPDNGELAEWSSQLHHAHILPSIEAASTLPPSATDPADLLRSLAAGISRTSKEAEHQNKIQLKQLDYINEKDAKKKNKVEKWHPTSRRLVLNAASSDSNPPPRKSQCPTFASSTATPPEWPTKSSRAKCWSLAMLMPVSPMALP